VIITPYFNFGKNNTYLHLIKVYCTIEKISNKGLDSLKLKDKLERFRVTLNTPISFLLIFAAALLATAVMFKITPTGIGEIIELFKKTNFLTPLLNFLPVLLSMLFLFFLTGNTVLSAGIISLVVVLLSFTNRYKIIFRNDPFFPYDFALAPELSGVIKSFGAGFIMVLIIAVILAIFAVVFCLYMIRTYKLPLKKRLFAGLFTFLLMLCLNMTVYSSESLYQSLPALGSVYNLKDVFNGRGFLYCFIHTYNTSKIEKPVGYDKNAIVAYIDENNALEPAPEMVRPHIIVIMSEAFSELGDTPLINFKGYTDPLENFKEIKKDSVYGRVVVPNLGGGTSDTEFDFLTGANSRFLRNAPYAYRLVLKELEAMPSLLGRLGYKTEAIHPGHAWFYNRQNVYPFMGFESFYDISYFDQKRTKGMYITEEACFDKIIEQYESREPDKPYFSFTVSIENHGPYEDKLTIDTNFNTELELSTGSIRAMTNYFEGLKDADIELKRIVDYFEEDDEPVVLVFFGDHLPAFQLEVYDALMGGVDENGENTIMGRTLRYAVPFLIWQNQPARESTALEENMKNLYNEDDILISSFYLGPLVMEALELDSVSPFLQYVSRLRREYPVIMENEYFDSEGNPHSVEENEELIFYKHWLYYKIFDE